MSGGRIPVLLSSGCIPVLSSSGGIPHLRTTHEDDVGRQCQDCEQRITAGKKNQDFFERVCVLGVNCVQFMTSSARIAEVALWDSHLDLASPKKNIIYSLNWLTNIFLSNHALVA